MCHYFEYKFQVIFNGNDSFIGRTSHKQEKHDKNDNEFYYNNHDNYELHFVTINLLHVSIIDQWDVTY